jgi:sirohydrochlorin ferrochelatase
MSRAILIVDHGSRRPEAHEHLERLAARVRERTPACRVRVAHMEIAPPSIEEGIDACVEEGATEIAVHPLVLVPGRHLSEDVPALLESAAKRHPGVRIWLTPPLGEAAELADAIARLAGEGPA